MKSNFLLLNQNNLSLAKEYRKLISLPIVSEPEAERMVEILEFASLDESLNCLIEEIETRKHRESKQDQGFRHLLELVSTDASPLT